jgi:hypothetical protein
VWTQLRAGKRECLWQEELSAIEVTDKQGAMAHVTAG